MTGAWFLRLAARDLDGREVALPAGLPGEWTVVIVAFRRERQGLVDSWVPLLEQRAAADPRLGLAELSAIGLPWQSARPVIDGGMAAAIRDQKTRRRTLYGVHRHPPGDRAAGHLRPEHDLVVPGGPGRPGVLARLRWPGRGHGRRPHRCAGRTARTRCGTGSGPWARTVRDGVRPRFRLPLAALGSPRRQRT